MKKTGLFILISFVLCTTLLLSACKTDNPEKNRDAIVSMWNSELSGESNGSGAENGVGFDAAKWYEDVLSQIAECEISAELNGDKESLYLGIKDGTVYSKAGNSDAGYAFITDDFKIVSVSEYDGQLYSDVTDLSPVFGMLAGGSESGDSDTLPEITLPEITKEMITITEDGKYVISNEYMTDLMTEVMMVLQGIGGEETTDSSIAVESQKNAVKAMIETYMEALNMNVYLTAESEKITGMGISVSAEGDDADELFGLEKLSASLTFDVDGENNLVTGLDFAFEYREKGADKSYNSALSIDTSYNDKGEFSKISVDADINMGGITIDSSEHYSSDGEYTGTRVKGDLSAQFDFVYDSEKMNEENGEVLNISLKTVIGNMKAYTVDMYNEILDQELTSKMFDGVEYYFNINGNATAVDENSISVAANVTTNIDGAKTEMKFSGECKFGSADKFPAIPSDVIAEKDRALKDYNPEEQVGGYFGQY